MTRKWMLENLELLNAYMASRKVYDISPLFSDLVNTTGRMEVAVFLDDKYPDQKAVRDSLLRGKEFGVRHVIPETARHTLRLAEELGLDVLKAKLPPTNRKPRTFGPWRLAQRRLHKTLYYGVKPGWVKPEPSKTSNWRSDWRDWAMVARCDHVVVFRRRDSKALAHFAAKVEEYPHMAERVHIFEAGKDAPAPQRKKGRSME